MSWNCCTSWCSESEQELEDTEVSNSHVSHTDLIIKLIHKTYMHDKYGPDDFGPSVISLVYGNWCY